MEAPIPPGMEKPPHLNEYDGVADPVNHIDGFEAMQHYHNVGTDQMPVVPHDLEKEGDGLV